MRVIFAALATVVSVASSVSVPRAAHAESLPEMIPRLLQQGGWLRAHHPGLDQSSPERPADTERHEPASAPSAFLGDQLHFSFVARDWRAAFSLTDGRALVFDRVRLISSSRMAVQRIALAGGRLMPYAEVSFGYWRVDTDLMPYLHSQSELAAQVAAGIEFHIAPRAAFAWDVERTTMYRDPRDPSVLPFASIVASFAAVRAEF
jgi:hypothetical protein